MSNIFGDQQNIQEYRSQTLNANINIAENNIELENSYPEIYRTIYPIVSKKCDSISETKISKIDIEKFTDEIYAEASKNNNEKRQINSGLRDLIQILLIRELLNRRRPPVSPHPPMRPPFRPGPGRPPFNREFSNFNDLYEQF